MLVQLKPSEESFTSFVLNRLKRLDVILLCEGRTEVEIIKAVVKKLDVEVKLHIGLTDCEGIDALPRLASTVALLANLSRKLKVLSVLVDAETMNFIDRVNNIISSLRAKKLWTTSPQPIAKCDQVFQLYIKTYFRKLPLIIAVSGIKEFEFVKHCIEDHGVRLMLLERNIDSQEVLKYSEAEQIVRRNELIEIIKNSKRENTEKAFNHITCLLDALIKKSQELSYN
ncbi:MAG: DUF3226 domain-containing protein [Candidatus Asgardarchaeia archaeon]